MVYHFAMDFGVICGNAEKNGGPRHDQIGLSEPVSAAVKICCRPAQRQIFKGQVCRLLWKKQSGVLA